VLTDRLRDRDDIARDLVGVAGLTALAIGLVILAPTKALGFNADHALKGILDALPVTLPAALLMLVVTAVDLGSGLVIARLVRRTPFDSITDAALSAMVATVLKDLAFLAILGQIGLFRSPILWVADVLILAAASRVRPMFAKPAWRPSLEGLGSLPFAALIGIVWTGPILLQLASPVVPFIDVLPNHVAPAEHLRTFGSFGPLTETQSPIYGPSRTLLGYIGLLGTLTTMSGLPATLALSAFILPSTILVGIGAYRLATAVAGSTAGPWALFAFALTGTFARLSDDRATVVVLPLVAWALALLAERLRAEERADFPGTAPSAQGPWLSEGVLLGLGLAAAIFVHPIIGALAVATVGAVAVALPGRAGSLGITAAFAAAIAAIPQLTTMVGIPLPTSFAIAGIPVAILVGRAIEPATVLHRPILRLARWTPAILIPIAVYAATQAEFSIDNGPRPIIEGVALLLLAGSVGRWFLPAPRSALSSRLERSSSRSRAAGSSARHFGSSCPRPCTTGCRRSWRLGRQARWPGSGRRRPCPGSPGSVPSGCSSSWPPSRFAPRRSTTCTLASTDCRRPSPSTSAGPGPATGPGFRTPAISWIRRAGR
jgi:hypothetical protein